MPKVTYDVRTAVRGEKDGAKRVSGRSKEGVKTLLTRRRRTGTTLAAFAANNGGGRGN